VRSKLIATLALVAYAALVSGAASHAATSPPGKTARSLAGHRPAASPARHPVHTSHHFGALRPKKEVRAVKPSAAVLAALPASVDLRAWDVPVGNQGNTNSCVTWTIDYGMLGWYSKRYGVAGQPFNPMYTYSQIHTPGVDSGSYPRDALNIAYNQGNDTQAHYSHTMYDWIDQPNASERANAAHWRISGYQTLFDNTTLAGGGSPGAGQIETALANGKPVAIALKVRNGFYYLKSTDVGPDGKVLDTDTTSSYADPTTGHQRLHEVLAVGYDQYGVWVQNSWGTTDWGASGYGRMSWSVVGQDVYSAHTISGFVGSASGDVTPPTMGAVTERIAIGQKTTATTVPTLFQWSATDTGGIGAYSVWVKTDNGGWFQDTNIAANATSHTYALSIGHSYTVAVAAKDTAGNWSSYNYSPTINVQVTDDQAFTLNGPWSRFSLAGTFGGTYAATSQAGAFFQYTATARDLGLVGLKFSTAGRATVYCDGTSVGTLDEYNSSTVTQPMMAQCHFGASASHTIKVVVEGTSGRPWIGVDAFARLS